MCGWENPNPHHSTKRVLWLRIQPNSHFIKGSYLKFDHTTKSQEGNYLVWPMQMQHDDYAVLRSPLIRRKSHKLCFTLYYFAQQANSSSVKRNVPAFRVRLLNLSKGSTTNLVESVNATPTLTDWSMYRREFTDLPSTFQFQIEATYNADIGSDIGIDDITIERKSCTDFNEEDPYWYETTTPMPAIERALDCNFDDTTLCLWDFDDTAWNITNFSGRELNLFTKARIE